MAALAAGPLGARLLTVLGPRALGGRTLLKPHGLQGESTSATAPLYDVTPPRARLTSSIANSGPESPLECSGLAM